MINQRIDGLVRSKAGFALASLLAGFGQLAGDSVLAGVKVEAQGGGDASVTAKTKAPRMAAEKTKAVLGTAKDDADRVKTSAEGRVSEAKARAKSRVEAAKDRAATAKERAKSAAKDAKERAKSSSEGGLTAEDSLALGAGGSMNARTEGALDASFQPGSADASAGLNAGASFGGPGISGSAGASAASTLGVEIKR